MSTNEYQFDLSHIYCAKRGKKLSGLSHLAIAILLIQTVLHLALKKYADVARRKNCYDSKADLFFFFRQSLTYNAFNIHF